MKNKKIIFLLLTVIALTSCGQNNKNPHILRNGDLFNENDISINNAFNEIKGEEVLSLIKNEENSLLYIYQDECQSCNIFKPIILDYISTTHNLVNTMNVTNNIDEVSKLLNSDYGPVFFPHGSSDIVTPRLFIIGENIATMFPISSRGENKLMFKNAMNDYVFDSNVYSFINLNKYKEMVNNNDKLLTVLIDRSNESLMRIYKSQIKSSIFDSNKDVALLDVSKFSRNDVLTYFNIESLEYPYSFYKLNNKKESHYFTPNSVNEGLSFLNNYYNA